MEILREAISDLHLLCITAIRCVSVQSLKMWGVFAVCAFILFWLYSSGDFSFILTLSSMISLFSFIMVALEIQKRRLARGVSSHMMECYMLVFAARLCAVVPFEGYLPYDKSGDWLYQLIEVCTLGMAVVIVAQCRLQHSLKYNATHDSLNTMYLICPALLLALVAHPHLNRHAPTDIAWTFALYLESVAVLCQFFMFMNEGRARSHTAHFLAGQALSKFLSFLFWSSSFSELSAGLDRKYSNTSIAIAVWVLGIQMVQLLIMVDFIHNYVFCIFNGIPVSRVYCSEENV